MPDLYVKLDYEIVTLLTNQICNIAEQLENELVLELRLPDDDPELSSCWKHSLLEELQADCQNLLFLLRNEAFGQKPFFVEIEFAEAALRACSALRHKMRSSFLIEISDYDLESGNLDLTRIAPSIQGHYTCYVCLAFIQESIIQSIEFA